MLAQCVLALLAARVRAAANDTADAKELVSKQQTFGADTTYDTAPVDPYLYGGADDEAYNALAQAGAQYYGDEFDTYYADMNAYAASFGDDVRGDTQESCTEGKDGKANMTVPVCDVTISGVDEEADRLEGGVDGTYKVTGCHDARPTYVRDSSDAEERILWYSAYFKDWEISRGSIVNMTQAALLMYQHGNHKYSRPDLVPSNNWHLRSEHSSKSPKPVNGTLVAKFRQVPVAMKCVKGQKAPKDPPPTPQLRPLLDDSEMTKKYREVHTRYNALGDPNPTVNLTLVFFVILAGMAVVLGIPYMMYGKKSGQVKSWAQQLEDSRKVRVGHVS